MANVAEGLGQSGDLSDSQFSALLAEQARAGRDGSPIEQAEKPEAHDASRDTTDDILASFGVDEVTTSVADGLSFASEKGGAPKYGISPDEGRRIHAEHQRLEREGAFDGYKATTSRRETESERVRILESQLASAEFERAIENVETARDEALLLARLKRTAPSQFEGYLERRAYESLGLDPEDDDLDYQDFDAVDERLAELRASVAGAEQEIVRSEAAEQLRRATHAADQLSEQRARELLTERKEFVNRWAHERGLASPEARRRIAAAEQVAREHFGIELFTHPNQQEWTDVLRASLAVVEESERASRERAFQQAVLDSETTSVSDGFEVFGPLGWQRLSAAPLPPAFPDPERTARRAVAERLSAASVRAAVSAPEETSIASGLTANGRPISLDDATGARERHERERADELARTRQFLPG